MPPVQNVSPELVAPYDLLRPGRTIQGCSAVLLPFTGDGAIDLDGFVSLLGRTEAAGLVPAVNMDTGYVHLLTPAQRLEVLDVAQATVSGPLLAGAFVADEPGASFDRAATAQALHAIADRGATPVLFPSFGLAGLDADGLVDAHRWVGEQVDRFVAFELGEVFSPAGRIWDLDTYEAILGVESCVGAKHSSLHRAPEWDRLRVRDRVRPEFHVYTGNDLAIDQVAYGSDYLLGLSAFAPDLFAARDAAWAAGDPSFHERNDDLQAVGTFAFRDPVPGYRDDVAMLLVLRGWLAEAHPHPAADAEVLAALWRRLEPWVE